MAPSDHAHSADAWDSHASKWAGSVQAITLAPCTTLLTQASSILSLDSPSPHVLDNGAGSGQLTGLIKARYPDIPIVASDISKGMLESLGQKATTEGWRNTRTAVQDAQDLNELSNDSFSHVFCTFVINFTQDPRKAISEMHRVLRPGGVVGLLTWSRVSWVPCWEAAVRKVQGGAKYEAPLLFHPDTLETETMREAMDAAGFKSFNIETVQCFHPEKSVDDATAEFYGMGNPSIKLLMKEFCEEFIEQTKPHFKAAYSDIYAGGCKRQFEVAILAVGKKADYSKARQA